MYRIIFAPPTIFLYIFNHDNPVRFLFNACHLANGLKHNFKLFLSLCYIGEFRVGFSIFCIRSCVICLSFVLKEVSFVFIRILELTVHDGQPSGIQFAVNDLVRQAEIDKFQLNETKCKELQISFSRSVDPFEAVTINNKPIEVVTSAKLLGLTISINPKWNAHIENVIKKGASRLFLLRQLKVIP